jgi:hypothetical protein
MLKLIATMVASSGAAAVSGLLGFASHAPVQHTVTPVVVQHVVIPGNVHRGCTVAAPSTAAGFQSLFKSAPAADIGISFVVGGRSVWLWGDDLWHDTRSSLTVQDRGCLKTTGQLFPVDATGRIFYWIKDGKALSSRTFSVTGRQMEKTGAGVWDWKETGYDLTLKFSLLWDNTVVKTATGSLVRVPSVNQGGFLTCPTTVAPVAGQFCYSQHLHPEFKLASGKTLRSTARNVDHWTGNVDDYRIIFDEK